MDYNGFMTILAETYKQPIYNDKKEERPNMQYALSFKWVNENVSESELEAFLSRIVEIFIPTNENNFPLPAHLRKIRIDMLNGQSIKYEPDYKSLPELAEEHSINEKDIIKNADLETMVNDDMELEPGQMLKKYGKDQCCRLWPTHGMYSFDHNINQKVMVAMNFKYSMISQYLVK